MFGAGVSAGLTAGEIRNNQNLFDEVDDWLFAEGFDDYCYQLTLEVTAEDSEPAGYCLPQGFDLIPPGPLLSAALAMTDRSKLNGYDLVRILVARERQVAHYQAQSMADTVEISYATPGNVTSSAGREEEAFVYASDEIRAALTLTRRAAEARMSLASEIRERLPQLWEMLDTGTVDLARARVIVKGVSHLTEEQARQVVDTIAGRAPNLTTGQLAAWIRRLCVDNAPEKARQRYEHALENRLIWIEQTPDGTGNIHLLDIPIDDARAIGRRINSHMISLKKKTDPRTHDQLRADITIDLLLGSDPTLGGRGLIDIRVDLTTLAQLDQKSAEIPGMGPVIADIARKIADRQHKAEWRATITNQNGQIIDIITTTRRPTKALSRYIQATQPTCTYPGCRTPATNTDYDHLTPHSQGGPTSAQNGGPKCRHDHILKDHGWTHQHLNDQDHWTSPHGHTYTTEKPPKPHRPEPGHDRDVSGLS